MRKIGNRFAAVCESVNELDIVKLLPNGAEGEIVPLDEPLFLVRARDRLAIPLLRHFRELCVADGCNDYMLGLTDHTIAQFELFANLYPERMKQPGVTRGR
jgi:hypothetical protein